MTEDQVFIEFLGNFSDVMGDGKIYKSVILKPINLIFYLGMVGLLRSSF